MIGSPPKPGDTLVYLFTTGWEFGEIRDPKQMSRRQQRVAKEMESPYLVWYPEDHESTVHDLADVAKYLPENDFDCMNNQPPNEHPTLEAGVWCLVKDNEKA